MTWLPALDLVGVDAAEWARLAFDLVCWGLLAGVVLGLWRRS